MEHFVIVFIHYLKEVIPALMAGFIISGFVHELIPEDVVLKYLGKKGIVPILVSTVTGALLPVCCWGSLPIAVSFYKKGAKLGPILAFLVATPATSISAVLVTYSVLGLRFAIYTFLSVIVMGIAIGFIGNMIKYESRRSKEHLTCPHCDLGPEHKHIHKEKTLKQKMISGLKYAFIELPKEIGLELFIGLILAAIVATFLPLGRLIKMYLGGWFGYAFSIIFGILMYICSTASVPLIDSLIRQGMSSGAGMTLLLIGPITSYGTILVIHKEFGMKVLTIFLASLVILTLLCGVGFQLLQG